MSDSKDDALNLSLLWGQEFDGPTGVRPDSDNYWNYDIGTGSDGWGNQEHEYYTDQNATFDGSGNLVIRAERLSDGDPLASGDPRVEFYSSRLNTKDKVHFKYGRIEARIKMPNGQGSWPAFWMLGARIAEVGWPACGEIDIIEVGDIKNEVVASLHGPGYFGDNPLTNRVLVEDTLTDEFHTYAINWLPGEIEWFVDGQSISKKSKLDAQGYGSEWVFDQPFFILINLAMGGVFVPNGIDPKLLSAELSIDYIRHYSIDGIGEVNLCGAREGT
ncbi:MAG: glycoside hydrolase family 16 protein [Actinobacteria bacterium]|nr:glycoside hydrolase family 16 protein [Actinomycetota bacterium]NBY15920.1 glycoside hydrolase family 16 protein [Actinomycetota bacterium]